MSSRFRDDDVGRKANDFAVSERRPEAIVVRWNIRRSERTRILALNALGGCCRRHAAAAVETTAGIDNRDGLGNHERAITPRSLHRPPWRFWSL